MGLGGLCRGRIVVWELSDRGLEHTATELGILVPLAQGAENGEDLLIGVGTGIEGVVLDSLHHEFGALVEDLDDELVLGAKVVVERHFRDACLFEDPIDACRVETLGLEEFAGTGEDFFAFGACHFRILQKFLCLRWNI